MAVTDADILDIVRRLRTYMMTLDNCHLVLNGLANIEDEAIAREVEDVLPGIQTTALRVSKVLKSVEASKGYRDMLKKFNMKEETEEEDYG